MDKLEELKQHMDLICDEINVKQIRMTGYRPIFIYDRASRKFIIDPDQTIHD